MFFVLLFGGRTLFVFFWQVVFFVCFCICFSRVVFFRFFSRVVIVCIFVFVRIACVFLSVGFLSGIVLSCVLFCIFSRSESNFYHSSIYYLVFLKNTKENTVLFVCIWKISLELRTCKAHLQMF